MKFYIFNVNYSQYKFTRTQETISPDPMVIFGLGGRIAGAGKTAYLANGYSMKTFECAALGQHPDLALELAWIKTDRTSRLQICLRIG